MGLEIGTYVDDLNINNPLSGDLKSVGDNHIRLIKQVLKNTFPNANKPFPFPRVQLTTPPSVIPASSYGMTYVVTTAGGAVTLQLPALTSGDAGWECGFIKNSTDVNPIFMIPPVSTVLWSGEYAGLNKVRRAIPGRRFTAYWSGGEWFVSRNVGKPLGSIISGYPSLLPGYVWPNGQTLAGVNYPEYIAYVQGAGLTPDLRGRTDFGSDDMGGAVGRIGAVVAAANGSSGGAETTTLAVSQVPALTFSGTTTAVSFGSLDHYHGFTAGFPVGACPFSGGQAQCASAASNTLYASTTGFDLNNHGHNYSGATSGGGGAHSNMPPSFVLNKMLVVE